MASSGRRLLALRQERRNQLASWLVSAWPVSAWPPPQKASRSRRLLSLVSWIPVLTPFFAVRFSSFPLRIPPWKTDRNEMTSLRFPSASLQQLARSVFISSARACQASTSHLSHCGCPVTRATVCCASDNFGGDHVVESRVERAGTTKHKDTDQVCLSGFQVSRNEGWRQDGMRHRQQRSERAAASTWLTPLAAQTLRPGRPFILSQTRAAAIAHRQIERLPDRLLERRPDETMP